MNIPEFLKGALLAAKAIADLIAHDTDNEHRPTPAEQEEQVIIDIYEALKMIIGDSELAGGFIITDRGEYIPFSVTEVIEAGSDVSSDDINNTIEYIAHCLQRDDWLEEFTFNKAREEALKEYKQEFDARRARGRFQLIQGGASEKSECASPGDEEDWPG